MRKNIMNLFALAALLMAPVVATAQTDSCSMTINGHDSYGDGWNGNTLTVYQNGVQIQSFTISSGNADSLTFNVGSDAPVSFVYTVAGSYTYPSENSFTIKNGFGEVVYTCTSGASLTSGDTCYTASVPCPSCAAPTALQITNKTNNGATLSWTAGGEETSWIVKVNGEEIEGSPVSEPTVDLSGYEANTNYTVEIFTNCDDGNTSSALSGSFKTLCANGNCEISLDGVSSYNGYAEVWQNGGMIASVTDNGSVDICNGDSLVVTFHSGSFNSSTIIVYDVSGIELASFSAIGHNTGDTILAIENGCPSCIPPTEVYSNEVGSHSAHIGWVDNNIDGIGDYAIYVNGELVDIVNNDTVYDLSDLSASTNLTVGVARICEEGDTSGARTTTFRTNCGAVTLPYFENFEGLGFNASNGLPIPCWIAYYTCTTGGRTFPCGSADGSNPTMAFAADPEMTIFIATDTIPVSGDSVFVSFRAQPSGNIDFWCGVMSDPYDSTTFIPIGAGIHTTNAPNQWGEYVFSTVGFSPDTSYRVAFKYTGHGYTGNWVNVDDIEIRVFDGCIRPMNLYTDTVTTESATLNWEVYGTEESWLLTVNDEEPVVITEKPYTLEGLEANTVYNVSIAALCQSGDTTQAVGTSFRTPCAGDTCVVTVTVPYTNYELIQNGSSFGIVEGSNYGETYNVCYGTELFIHTTEIGSSYYNATIINAAGIELYTGTAADSALLDTVALGQPCPSCMPAINLSVDSITAEGCTFSWDAMNDENVQEWIVYVDGEALAEPVTGTSTTITGLTANEDHVLGVRANCGDEDSSIIRTTNVHTLCSEGNCEFVVSVSDYYGSINVWQSGEMVSNIDASNVTVSLCLGEPITLTWNSGYYTYYGFSISKGDSTLLTVADASGYNTGDTIMTFDGQCEATAYDVPDPSTPGTDCAAPTALTATPAETTISISFSGSATEYQVGIVEGSTWNEGDADIDDTYNTEYTFSDLTAGTTYTIGVRAVCYNYSTYSDTYSTWVTTTATTTGGVVDTCNAPTGLQTLSVDSNRAVIRWTAGGDESEWQIKVNNDEDNLITATSTTYVMSNLTPGTQYKVRVRAVCSATNQSGWSSELSFTTSNVGIEPVDGIVSSLSPNPATSMVAIETSSEAMVSIVDLNGREVYRSAAAATTHRVDVSNMAKGAYFVRIVTENGSAVRKLIVR